MIHTVLLLVFLTVSSHFLVPFALGQQSQEAKPLRLERLEFDDANKRVTFRLKVIEGAQYKMGVLSLTGIPDETAARLKSQWKLSPGAVYDSSYVADFINLVVAKDTALAKALPGKNAKVSASEIPDRQSLTVNVTITFK